MKHCISIPEDVSDKIPKLKKYFDAVTDSAFLR
jgi:hypothetical protein